jgi:hypothetical protein
MQAAITCNLANADFFTTKFFYFLPAAPSTATTSATIQGTLISELEAAEIIPDVLDTFNPSAKLNLVFATDKGTLQVSWLHADILSHLIVLHPCQQLARNFDM